MNWAAIKFLKLSILNRCEKFFSPELYQELINQLLIILVSLKRHMFNNFCIKFRQNGEYLNFCNIFNTTQKHSVTLSSVK